MVTSWDHLGEIANIAQLTGLDAVRLIGMIVKAASTARMHKKNCRHFAQHLKLIGNLLEQLRISELKKYPETREPLEQLEDALRRSYILVNSCQDRSYLYLLAMGWNIVYQFRKAQAEIDRYLKIVPLITLVDNARFKERLEDIERDQREYTLDEEDRKIQDAIMRPDATVLKKTLSCSYPNLPFCKALQKENEKLQMELQRSQANMDVGECQMIQHLIDVTETAANSLPDKSSPKNTQKLETDYSYVSSDNGHSVDESYVRQRSDNAGAVSRNDSSVSLGHDLISSKGSHRHEEWHADLLGCCSEPSLCMKTFFFPCGTFSKIATVAANRHICIAAIFSLNLDCFSISDWVMLSADYLASGEACNELMAYTLILACCCYTCCVRRKLRRMLNISGGLCDDFLSHLLCCCCALVQEWREVEIRGVYSPEKTKTSPPPSQYMEY